MKIPFNLTESQLEEMVDYLQSSMVCYVNKDTGKVISTLDFDNPDAEDYVDMWQDALDEIEETKDQLVKITSMPSRKGYQIMEAFAEQVQQPAIKDRLFFRLNSRGPFRGFKDELAYHDMLDAWYSFQKEVYKKWLISQLEYYSED